MLAVGPSVFTAPPGLSVELPWSCGESYAYTQGPDGDESHSGFARHAWDFAMPLGTDVVAVHGGTVSMIEMSSRAGGCSEVYARDANYVLIDHHDGTAGLYLHVEGGSSTLRMGDPVAAGDVIARVGQTGWSCGPHLHVQVQEICGSWWCQSLPVAFHGVEALVRGEPIEKPGCGPTDAVSDTWLRGLLAAFVAWAQHESNA